MNIRTKAVLAGVAKDPGYNSVITPIYPTSTFRFEELGAHKGYDYTRSGNPTRAALEENIATLEGGMVHQPPPQVWRPLPRSYSSASREIISSQAMIFTAGLTDCSKKFLLKEVFLFRLLI